MIFSIIGGASGVGKTSLLRSFSDIKQVNTGDLFQQSMSLENRDEIRKGDWSVLEGDVTKKLADISSESIRSKKDLIIDTHFAAKIYGSQYRIGLKEEYLYQLGKSILKLCVNEMLTVNVILISADPHSLLTRRRLDRSRNRELVPSDCYRDLRYNDVYSRRYLTAFRRAEKNIGMNMPGLKMGYFSVENEAFDLSEMQLISILRR